MESFKNYITSFWKGLWSLLVGMKVTGKEFVTPKGIACGICQMNCPNGTIKVLSSKITTEDGKTKRVLDKYMYDLGSCTFCQLCVITCPHDALEFVPDFEHAVFTREKLVKQLNHTTEATVENK